MSALRVLCTGRLWAAFLLGFSCSVLVAASLLVTWYSRRTILSSSPSLPLYRCNSTPTSARFAESIRRWAPSSAKVHWLPGVASAGSCALFALSLVVHEVFWYLGLDGRAPPSLLCWLLGADQAVPMGGKRGGRSPTGAMPVAASIAPHLYRCHGGRGQPLCLRGRAMRV